MTFKGKHYIGWFNDDDELLEEGEVTIKPGQGLWTYSDYDGFEFVWPGVSIAK